MVAESGEKKDPLPLVNSMPRLKELRVQEVELASSLSLVAHNECHMVSSSFVRVLNHYYS